MTSEELADVAIGTVQMEPTQPTGMGMRTIIAGLFEQVARKATLAEQDRCLAIVGRLFGKWGCVSDRADVTDPPLAGFLKADLLALETRIREGKR